MTSWLRTMGACCLLLSMVALLGGCKSQSNGHSPQTPVDLLHVLKHLPDSLQENPFDEGMGLALSTAEMDQLLEQKELGVANGYNWRIQFKDKKESHLEVVREGAENGLRYDLLRLSGPKTSNWALVLQSVEDHCCSYFRWALYESAKGMLMDQTAGRMPSLDWSDFYADSQIAIAWPEPPSFNRYPFSMQVQNEPLALHLELVADYLDLNLPPDKSAPMLKNLPDGPRTLVWKDQRFIWTAD